MRRRTPFEIYQDRLWRLRDLQATLRDAEEKGLLQGRIECVQTLQEILNVPIIPEDELARLGLDGLIVLINELKTEFRKLQR